MYVSLLAIVVVVAAYMAGIFAPPFMEGTDQKVAVDQYKCCDTGDGNDCKPQRNKTIQWQGETYALLKSDAYISSESHDLFHLQGVMPREFRGPRQERVFLNPNQKSSGVRPLLPQCTETNPLNPYDRIYGESPGNGQARGCYRIPDDMLIYLCRHDSSEPGACNRNPVQNARTVKFDVYIRLSDVPDDNINGRYPSIARCYKPPRKLSGETQIVFKPSPAAQENLQLRTFSFTQPEPMAEWFAPFCKPAIYLYPERKTEINVKVFPKGDMLLTIPEYPKNGWDVIAEPNGNIFSEQKRFDYLYYEAALPDTLIQKPKEGYVIRYNERETFLRTLVKDLGLNEKETAQFVEYWAPILPESPYYFIGIVPVSHLDAISPLSITPKPDNLIRVSLYFQALEKPIHVTPPSISAVSREGFTVVEWGGIFKQDKEHPFSCFM